MDERELCCDISFYQDAESTVYKPDLGRLINAGIHGVIPRHSQNAVLDRMFEWYWSEAIFHDVPRMTYGLLQYWQGSADSGAQGKFIADWFKGKPKTRGWCDFERPSALYPELPPRQNCLDMIHNWMDQVDLGMGIESGLYTNLTTITHLSPIPDWLINRPFWLSWPPTKPVDVDATTWVKNIIQTTKNMNPPQVPFPNLELWQFTWVGPGELAGMESKGLDGDWFMGSGGIDGLRIFCGLVNPVPPVPPVSQGNKIRDLISQLSILVKDLK